jgi:hypothetical protein
LWANYTFSRVKLKANGRETRLEVVDVLFGKEVWSSGETGVSGQ